jgi:hypothetical protein
MSTKIEELAFSAGQRGARSRRQNPRLLLSLLGRGEGGRR